jgi:hypothetical protein
MTQTSSHRTSGNFHHDGLVAEVDLNELAANDYLADTYGQFSPDGRDHFPVVAAKIFRMATTEPTLTAADLAQVAARTLVMAGDDAGGAGRAPVSLAVTPPSTARGGSAVGAQPGVAHGASWKTSPSVCRRPDRRTDTPCRTGAADQPRAARTGRSRVVNR